MNKETIDQITAIGTCAGSVATAIGVWCAYKALQTQHQQLRDEHEWNRRQFAAQMLSEWSERILVHRKAIEERYAAFIDSKDTNQRTLSFDEAKAIYRAKSSQKEDWEMRFHLISLFNYFEFIAVAYDNFVADRDIIENSFKDTMIKYYDALNPFIRAVTEGRNIDDAWGPYVNLIRRWTPPPPDNHIKTGR